MNWIISILYTSIELLDNHFSSVYNDLISKQDNVVPHHQVPGDGGFVRS